MKKIFTVLILVIFFVSCGNKKSESVVKTKNKLAYPQDSFFINKSNFQLSLKWLKEPEESVSSDELKDSHIEDSGTFKIKLFPILKNGQLVFTAYSSLFIRDQYDFDLEKIENKDEKKITFNLKEVASKTSRRAYGVGIYRLNLFFDESYLQKGYAYYLSDPWRKY